MHRIERIVLVLALLNFGLGILNCKAQTPRLWGMTPFGGQNDMGVIFSYDLTRDTEVVNYNFDSLSGFYPNGSLIQAIDGFLYGMTEYGGSQNQGTIFSYNTTTGVFSSLHNFGIDSDGKNPLGSLFQANDGLLYGMTHYGGRYGLGAIFSYNTSSGVYSDLHDFAGGQIDGAYPVGSLMQASNGLIYGMTTLGLHGAGIIFSYNATGSVYTVEHIFDLNVGDGREPNGSLIEVGDSTLYGLTYMGGSGDSGTLFGYNINSKTDTVLYSFPDYLTGDNPYGSLIHANNGLLYGLTLYGGTDTNGIIFSYDITTGNEAQVYEFAGSNNGGLPHGSLIQVNNRSLYGMTSYGGTANHGTIFSYDIVNNMEKVIHSFGGANDGHYPYGDLLEVDYSTGIKQLPLTEEILKLYPNPSTDKIHLDYPLEPLTLKICDITDKFWPVKIAGNEMDISALPAGVYFVLAQTETENWVARFVKE